MQIKFPLILDGATGTELQKRGYTGDVSAEQWVLDNPDSIIDIQSSYVDSGSDVLYSPSFGANRRKLEEHGIFNRTVDYNLRLAELSKKAADGKAFVAGDISPTGLFLSPLGEASFEELVDIYTEQAAGLEKAGVDLFVFETMMTLSDARAAVLAVRSVSSKPIFVTFTCDENGRSLSGTDITAALTVLQGMGIDAFGLNCSAGPEQMLPQLRRLREFARVPLIAKPNAGMPEIRNGKTVYDCTPEEFVSLIPEMLDTGVAIFGGCCGTTSEHIAALKTALDGASVQPPCPRHADMLPASTEKLPAYLPADISCGRIIEVGSGFEDELSDAMDADIALVGIRIGSWDDVEALGDFQYMISKPLCIVCDDAGLLESALRVYQGRALYEGSLGEDELLPLCDKYGLII